jgi:hypothetical protein
MTFSSHFLPRLALMPFLPLSLPLHQHVYLFDSVLLVNLTHVHSTPEKRIHV